MAVGIRWPARCFLPANGICHRYSITWFQWVGAPYHVTCHVTFVCTLPSLPSDTLWRVNTSLGLIRLADRVCNECRSSVTWPLALYTRKPGHQDQKFTQSKVAENFLKPTWSTKLCRPMFSRMVNKMKKVISIKESSKVLKMSVNILI